MNKKQGAKDRREAIKKDKDFYVEGDGGMTYIFGDNTGFAYKDVTNSTKKEIEEQIKSLKNLVKSTTASTKGEFMNTDKQSKVQANLQAIAGVETAATKKTPRNDFATWKKTATGYGYAVNPKLVKGKKHATKWVAWEGDGDEVMGGFDKATGKGYLHKTADMSSIETAAAPKKAAPKRKSSTKDAQVESLEGKPYKDMVKADIKAFLKKVGGKIVKTDEIVVKGYDKDDIIILSYPGEKDVQQNYILRNVKGRTPLQTGLWACKGDVQFKVYLRKQFNDGNYCAICIIPEKGMFNF